MEREINGRKLIILVTIYFVIIFFLNVWAIFFADGVKIDAAHGRTEDLCPHVTDPTIARHYSIDDIKRCPNVDSIQVHLTMKSMDE